MAFPSPAADFAEDRLSLDEHLIEHREATFFVRAAGNAMASFGIHDGDLMIVDRAVEPADQAVVVVVLDGEFVARQFCPGPEDVILRTGDSTAPIHIGYDQDLSIWGVVRYSVHKV
jgi:DNA polymerase V